MSFQNLMVIDPAIKTPEIESYNEISLRCNINTTYHLPKIHSPNSMKKHINNACGIILMGSAASVHDSFHWLNNIKEIIEIGIKNRIPILGICFGHQFLAHLFGGTVDYLWNTTKKRGIRRIKILENNRLNNTQEDYLIYSHQEGVTKCPENFDVFATSSMVKIEAIVHKHLPIWGFQPHIEASKTFAQRIGVSEKQFSKTQSLSVLLLESFLNKVQDGSHEI